MVNMGGTVRAVVAIDWLATVAFIGVGLWGALCMIGVSLSVSRYAIMVMGIFHDMIDRQMSFRKRESQAY